MTDPITTENQDLTTAPADAQEAQEAPEKEYSGRQIMCFVSKRMVPIEDTEEVEYSSGKSYRVLSRYLHFKKDGSVN